MKILAYRGRSLVSKAIQFQTRSPYSHIGVELEDGTVIEAWYRGGVRHSANWQTLHSGGTAVDVFTLRPTDSGYVNEQVALDWLKQQLGKKYDFLSVFRFLSHRKVLRNDSWFCSELVEAAIIEGGGMLLRGDPSYHSPRDTAMSPLLEFIGTRKWEYT